jgi:hypothetical protein
MTKIKNTFSRGIVNKDLDERFIPPDMFIDAENFLVISQDGSSGSVGKNVYGNEIKTNNLLTNASVIASKSDNSKERIFYFVTSDEFDVIFEYNFNTNSSTIVLKSSKPNSVLNFNKNNRILNVDIISSGEDNKDLIAWSGDKNPPRIANIEKAKTYPVDGFTETEISLHKPQPLKNIIVLPRQINSINTEFVKEKFLAFAYRWKYEDGFYSAISKWSRYAFVPGNFNLNYDSWENTGMINNANAIDITFNTGLRDVIGVDVLMKTSNSDKVYLVEKYDKEKEGFTNNQNVTFTYKNSKINKVLSLDQYYRSYDNTPLEVIAQCYAGDRLMFGNYIENYDIDTKIDLEVDFISESIEDGDNLIKTIENKSFGIDVSNQIDFKKYIFKTNPLTHPISADFSENILSVDDTGDFYDGDAIGKIQVKWSIVTSSIQPYNIYLTDENDNVIKQNINVIGSTADINDYLYEKDMRGTLTLDKYKLYVTSNTSFEYDSKITLFSLRGNPLAPVEQKIEIDCEDQLCLAKTNPLTPGYVGDIVPNTVGTIDLSSFTFEQGKTLFFSLDIEAYDDRTNSGNFLFFYILESNFLNLSDFFANSNFVNSFSGYNQIFKSQFLLGNTTLLNEGTLTPSISGNVLKITMPFYYREFTEIEDQGVNDKENKYTFFKVKDFNFISSKNNLLSSMHSNRDYEVGIVYFDKYGRKTTVLTNQDANIFIPSDFSITQNKLKVTTNFNPPSMAYAYQFVVKQVAQSYEAIYSNVFFEEGAFVWIKAEGDIKDKVKEGAVLIVKADVDGPVLNYAETKVLEVIYKEKDFIVDNTDDQGNKIIEPEGLYFKIKPIGFNISYSSNTSNLFSGSKSRHNGPFSVTTSPEFGDRDDNDIFIPYKIPEGTYINIEIKSDEYSKGNAWEYILTTYSALDYNSFQDFFENEVAIRGDWQQFLIDHVDYNFTPNGSNLEITCREGGYGSSGRRKLSVNIVVRSNALVILETKPEENLSASFFETPEMYYITNGQHNSGDSLNQNEHILFDAYNCFSFGNGAESNRIKDSFNNPYFYIDCQPTNYSDETYKRNIRFADITYSESFNNNNGLNRLNEFNLFKLNFKDDIEKVYGPIVKLKAQDTNLDVYQEDKVSIVYYGKDLLFNADGDTNLTSIDNVLGQQKTYPGEYGISFHSESFDDYGTNSYFTDIKRGVVLRKNDNNGLFEISSYGMKSYFKNLFRNNKINNIIGEYDSFNNFYVLNIQYNDTEYVTWVFSDENNGWLCRFTFNPEEMARMNNEFISFKNGELYVHNKGTIRNNFYGIQYDSLFSFNFSQEPSTRKNFKNIEIEGSTAVDVELFTDLNQGYINKADFEKKEGVFYAYVRNSNDDVDSSLLSCQGIGNCTISGLTLNFGFDLDSIISVGDQVRNSDLELVGTIVSKTANSLTLNAVANIVSGDFVLCSKPQSIENNDLLGYFMKVTCRFSSNTYQEIFSINSEVSKSFS